MNDKSNNEIYNNLISELRQAQENLTKKIGRKTNKNNDVENNNNNENKE